VPWRKRSSLRALDAVFIVIYLPSDERAPSIQFAGGGNARRGGDFDARLGRSAVEEVNWTVAAGNLGVGGLHVRAKSDLLMPGRRNGGPGAWRYFFHGQEVLTFEGELDERLCAWVLFSRRGNCSISSRSPKTWRCRCGNHTRIWTDSEPRRSAADVGGNRLCLGGLHAGCVTRNWRKRPLGCGALMLGRICCCSPIRSRVWDLRSASGG